MFSLNISYDLDLSQIYYKDWKDDLGNNLLSLGKRGNADDFVVIGDLEKPYFTKTKLSRMKKSDLLDLAEQYDKTYIYDDWLKCDIISELLSITCKDHYTSVYDNTRWHNLDYTFRVIGYSQGDAVKVLILDSEYNWNTEKSLQNLFYDVPVSGMLTFLDKEYYIDEFMSDVYNYDIEDILENFQKSYTGCYKHQILEFLKNNLPANLEYR